MNWEHFPDSPWGNADICPHGCIREHGQTNPVCIECDYPPGANIDGRHCNTCDAGTWHLDGKCLRCWSENPPPAEEQR